MKTLIAIAILLWTTAANAQLITGNPEAAEVLTVSTSVSTIAACSPLGVNSSVVALIQTNGAAIRFTLNGETPNTTDSYLLADGAFFSVGNWNKFKAVRAAGTDATVKVTCIRR